MKIRTSLVHLTTLGLLLTAEVRAQVDTPQGRIESLSLDPQSATVLHLRPGFVTSVRLPEEVRSVVLGDPGAFKGEHSETEPRLVFFKPSTPKPAKTNALITTSSGREVSLTLVSEGSSAHSGAIDYILEYQPARSFVIEPTRSIFLIGDSRHLEEAKPRGADAGGKADNDQKPSRPATEQELDWQGKQLRVAVGRTEESGQEMTVAFSVLNSSSRTIELLPPQIQLADTAKQKHGKTTKAEVVAIKAYRMTSRRLAPGASTEGVVVFERPAFKESQDRLLLQVAQAEEVDRPVLVPIAFVAPAKGAAQ